MTAERSSRDDWRHEYAEINNDIRNHSNLRFAIFTVYLAAVGSLMAVSFGIFDRQQPIDADSARAVGKVGGLLVTLLFFAYELRLQSLINHNLASGKKLEKSLGYTHLRTRPSWGWFRTHHVTTAFFLLLTGFWIWLSCRSSG